MAKKDKEVTEEEVVEELIEEEAPIEEPVPEPTPEPELEFKVVNTARVMMKRFPDGTMEPY